MARKIKTARVPATVGTARAPSPRGEVVVTDHTPSPTGATTPETPGIMVTVPSTLSAFVLLGATGTLLGHANTAQDAANLADILAIAEDGPVTVASVGNVHLPRSGPAPFKPPLTDAEKATRADQRHDVEITNAKATAVAAREALVPIQSGGVIIVPDVHTGGGARPPIEPAPTVGVSRATLESTVHEKDTSVKGTPKAGARDARETALHAKSADQVKAIAVKAGVTPKSKAENVAAIVKAEFPE